MKKFSCRAVGIWRLGFSDVFFQTNVELGLEARREEEKPISARDEAGHNSLEVIKTCRQKGVSTACGATCS